MLLFLGFFGYCIGVTSFTVIAVLVFYRARPRNEHGTYRRSNHLATLHTHRTREGPFYTAFSLRSQTYTIDGKEIDSAKLTCCSS